jgi:hypothetical protein
MKLAIKACLLTLLSMPTLSHSNETSSESFIEGKQQFSENQDKQIEANSWAMCSVAYSTLSKVNAAESPAYASKLNQFGNGAGIAIVMTYYKHMDTGDDPSSFNADFARVWQHGLTMRKSLIDVSATHVASNIEAHGLDVSLVKLVNTVSICSDNLDLQQTYIDTWRQIRELGMFDK